MPRWLIADRENVLSAHYSHMMSEVVGGEGAARVRGRERLANSIHSWHDNPFDDAICGVENLWTPFVRTSDSWPSFTPYSNRIWFLGRNNARCKLFAALGVKLRVHEALRHKVWQWACHPPYRHSINTTFPALNDSVCFWCADKVFSAEFPWINKIVCQWRGASACHFKFP